MTCDGDGDGDVDDDDDEDDDDDYDYVYDDFDVDFDDVFIYIYIYIYIHGLETLLLPDINQISIRSVPIKNGWFFIPPGPGRRQRSLDREGDDRGGSH